MVKNTKLKHEKNKHARGMLYILPGLFLIFLSLGSIFWITLIKYSFFILIAMALVVIYYTNESLMSHYRKKEMSGLVVSFGFLALIFVSLFFGIQTTQLPFKPWILGIGIVLFVFGLTRKR